MRVAWSERHDGLPDKNFSGDEIMNWEAVGAIAEAIASFGVIISLVYLAVHNRKQTVDNRLAPGSELAN